MKRLIKIALRILAVLLVLVLLLSILFSFPKVQTQLANRLTDYVNNKYDTDIEIEKIDLSYVGKVKLINVAINDSKSDTIIYANNLKTSLLSLKKIIKGNLELGTVHLTDAVVIQRTYKGEEDDELKKFINAFKKKNNDKPSKFKLSSDLVVLNNGRYTLYDKNKQIDPIVSYKNIFGKVESFKIKGSDLVGNVRDLQFMDINGLDVKYMATDFSYTKTQMQYLNTRLKTHTSTIETDIVMDYKDGDLSNFIEKVQITAEIKKGIVSLKDARAFYSELGTKDVFRFTANIKGTLENFLIENLKMKTDQKAVIRGDLRLINSFKKEKGFELVANIKHLESDREHLSKLLPNILGKTLPESFNLLGHFSMKGTSHITEKNINAKLNIAADIGNIQSNLKITNINNINQANYKGTISLRDLKLGELIGDPLIGNFSMDSEVHGKGFSLEHLDTKIKGKILKHQYKGYTYQNIDVEGTVKEKLFSGTIKADDPNIKFNFSGLADLSKKRYKFDFTSHVDFANFNKLNLFKRDSIAILKGDIKMVMIGNTLENMVGFIQFDNATYTNQLQDFNFKDFNVISTVIDSVQTLKINSKDIINGQIKGRFKYKDLGKLAQNAFGSIYTNYQAFEVNSNQHLDFKFKVFNQVVAVFFPDIQLGANTSIKGKINSDKNIFKLTFKSREVLAYDNYIEKIRLQIDNKNPLFNTQFSAKKIETKQYTVADIDLVNITLNDTLRFRSEFKGGKNLKDKYNLDFYHTINEKNQSIIGFKKSDITINNHKWFLNPNKDQNNKIIIDNTNGNITYHDFLFASSGQELLFNGEQQGSDYQNFNIDLDRINLSEIIPKIDKFDLKGLINGGIWIEKKNNTYIPTADIQLLDFYINDELQGDLIGEIKGTNTKRKYEIDVFLEKEEENYITAKGNFDLKEKNPTINLDINFNHFKLNVLNAIGNGVMENIRGTISGDSSIKGLLANPDFSGLLSVQDAGMYFPYINVDYSLDNNSKVKLNNQSFILDEAIVYDSLYKTSGTLTGSISHNYFKKWFLDLQINTENLLAINTPEEENALFYGTGFLRGAASFTGDTDNVNIAINGSSNPGTEITIPMSDIQTVETSSLIHFKTPETNEKETTQSIREKLSERFDGVTMDFNLEITNDASLQIVIDQATGSSLQGTGNGTIQMDIDTKGTFNMYGNYIVNEGFYNFKYGSGLINKPFTVKKGGSISFNGDPYKAELDIEAVYSTKANPEAILTEYTGTLRIPVNLNTKLTGELFNSRQDFSINIPNASLDLASELDFVLNDKDTGNMMIQFVSLLVTGSFFNEDKNLRYTGASAGSEGITTVTSLISNALLDVFSDPDDKIQFGFDYIQGNKITSTENQLGLSMATRLGKNKKIIINGEVNVPTGSQSNSNIAGNVFIELPLDKKENLRLKVFNRQNEIQYGEPEEGYTQGLGLSWQFSFDKNKKEYTEKKQDSLSKPHIESLKDKKINKSN
ncbi:MAG TPA: translocation/assembly module TamB [Lutibacter sp.]|nr:translocation/assembly module TamB [Lutibacter sp.]